MVTKGKEGSRSWSRRLSTSEEDGSFSGMRRAALTEAEDMGRHGSLEGKEALKEGHSALALQKIESAFLGGDQTSVRKGSWGHGLRGGQSGRLDTEASEGWHSLL